MRPKFKFKSQSQINIWDVDMKACRNNGWIMDCTKMDAENTPNTPEFVCPNPKVLDFNEKRLHWASVVRDINSFVNKFLLLQWVNSKSSCYSFSFETWENKCLKLLCKLHSQFHRTYSKIKLFSCTVVIYLRDRIGDLF